jgi:hypothetical protein
MIKITEVKIESTYTWGNQAQLKDWNTLRLCNPDWNSVKMTAAIGMRANVEVTVIENTWELLKEHYENWQEIGDLPNWAVLRII